MLLYLSIGICKNRFMHEFYMKPLHKFLALLCILGIRSQDLQGLQTQSDYEREQRFKIQAICNTGCFIIGVCLDQYIKIIVMVTHKMLSGK